MESTMADEKAALPPPNSTSPVSSLALSEISEKRSGVEKALQGREKVGVESNEDEDDGIDSGDTHISLRNVERVGVKVRGLGIEVVRSARLPKKPRKMKRKGEEDGKDEEEGRSENENDVQILKGVNADMPPGELVGILGSSGSGKVNITLEMEKDGD